MEKKDFFNSDDFKYAVAYPFIILAIMMLAAWIESL